MPTKFKKVNNFIEIHSEMLIRKTNSFFAGMWDISKVYCNQYFTLVLLFRIDRENRSDCIRTNLGALAISFRVVLVFVEIMIPISSHSTPDLGRNILGIYLKGPQLFEIKKTTTMAGNLFFKAIETGFFAHGNFP